jgi:hypothetical protein
MLNLVTDESMKKIDQLIKIFTLIILMFLVIFCVLLLMDWLFGELGWDYIPGVGKDSGTGFIPDLSFLLT